MLMNIFYLCHNVEECAHLLCDKHVVKMILEYAQLLSTCHFILDGKQVGYKPTHKNHPCNIWVRYGSGNYMWLFRMLVATCNEYTFRYGKIHKTSELLGILENVPDNIPIKPFQEPPQAMPEEYKQDVSIDGYLCYYKYGKSHLHSWKKRSVPEFISHLDSPHF